MAPKRRGGGKGKKGRRKGGKKKKDKKVKVLQEPPPLHLLTELYKKLDEETKMLYEMRIAARRKRIECWFMAKEIMNTKNDNDRYRDIVEENVLFLNKAMDKLRKLLEEERDSINKVIQALLDEYEKKRQEFLRQAELVEDELSKVKYQLLEFEPMMEELEKLLARLAELERDIEAAQLDADIKIRHLTNQFLIERRKVHNHLEEQLYNLIRDCRSYILPILWNFMQGLRNENNCLRLGLSRTGDRYINLSDQRDQLIQKRKLMTLEKPYWNIEWSFQKLEEMDIEKRRQRKIAREEFENKMEHLAETMPALWEKKSKLPKPDKIGSKTAVEKYKAFVLSAPNNPRQETLNVSTQLGRDFNAYLLQKLTAAKEAQERHAKATKREEKRFMKKILEEAGQAAGNEGAAAAGGGDGEVQGKQLAGYEGEQEGEGADYNEDEEREWVQRMNLKQQMESLADLSDEEKDEEEDEGEDDQSHQSSDDEDESTDDDDDDDNEPKTMF